MFIHSRWFFKGSDFQARVKLSTESWRDLVRSLSLTTRTAVMAALRQKCQLSAFICSRTRQWWCRLPFTTQMQRSHACLLKISQKCSKESTQEKICSKNSSRRFMTRLSPIHSLLTKTKMQGSSKRQQRLPPSRGSVNCSKRKEWDWSREARTKSQARRTTLLYLLTIARLLDLSLKTSGQPI